MASAVPDGRNMRPVDVMHRVSGKKLVLLEPRNVKPYGSTGPGSVNFVFLAKLLWQGLSTQQR